MDKKKKPSPNASAGGKIIKKPLGERFAETFFGGTVKDAKAFTVHEIIVPAIKNLVYESFTGALDRLLNGGQSNSRYGGYYGSNTWQSGVTIFKPGTNYSSYGSHKTKASQVAGYSGSSRNPATIVFNRKADADRVIELLRSELSAYPTVSVETYYDIASDFVQGADKLINFTDNYYGWSDLSMARTKPCQGGYVIVFPPTTAI